MPLIPCLSSARVAQTTKWSGNKGDQDRGRKCCYRCRFPWFFPPLPPLQSTLFPGFPRCQWQRRFAAQLRLCAHAPRVYDFELQLHPPRGPGRAVALSRRPVVLFLQLFLLQFLFLLLLLPLPVAGCRSLSGAMMAAHSAHCDAKWRRVE